jgi:hypothetical protein
MKNNSTQPQSDMVQRLSKTETHYGLNRCNMIWSNFMIKIIFNLFFGVLWPQGGGGVALRPPDTPIDSAVRHHNHTLRIIPKL